VNFTREPIIETIITPREGYRLIVRSTKHASDEEFTVDAVEVVSFGSALFYRSLEKPHPFLLPVADYQVVEGKESRVVLKNAQFERTIKIGGGREASFKKETEEESDEQMLPMGLEDESEESTSGPGQEPGMERKRERRRNRRRRGGHEHRDEQQRPRPEPTAAPSEPRQETPHAVPKEPFAAPLFTHLIPPPPNLISDSIQKYKEQQAKEPPASSTAPETAEASQKEGEGEANSISRTLIEPPAFTPGVSTMNDWSNFLS
jgi:hypothetical protein